MPSKRVRPPLRQDEDPRDSTDAGFTVLECIVAFVLFAIMAGASITAIVNATQANNSSRNRVTAADLAQQDLQQARSLRYPNYPLAQSAHTVTVGNTVYTVQRAIASACPTPSDTNNPAIAYSSGQATGEQVTTTVTWNGAAAPLKMATEIAC